MKKVFATIALIGLMAFGFQNVQAQAGVDPTQEQLDSARRADSLQAIADQEAQRLEAERLAKEAENKEANAPKKEDASSVDLQQTLKEQFIDGGVVFMSIVLIALILGLALCVERIIYLNMATTNTKKLVEEVEAALANGGIEAAKDVCRNTRGPVASIFYQGLDRSSEGIEQAEKAVIAYGGVQMGLLEKGLPWISLFIALAPMLGFMGTVIGMIQAFGSIVESGSIVIEEVALGIKVALLTTVFGLIVAIILQIFYNYIVSKIDSLVNSMEDASISLIDVLVKHNAKNNG